jgi:hypothetical protein
VPKSKVRKKAVYTPPAEIRQPAYARKRPSPQWVPILAVTLLVVGVAWLVVYYLSQSAYPIGAISYWNLVVGFGMLIGALAVLTQWR